MQHLRQLFFLFASTLLCPNVQAFDITLYGTCEYVIDGDSFEFLADGEKKPFRIRLAGIDCPDRGQPVYDKAKSNLKYMLYGHQIKAQLLADDEEGFTLAVVDADSVDPARAQCVQGYAWLEANDAQVMPMNLLQEYDNEIFEAKVRKIGIWKQSRPMPPWEYRKKKRVKR